MGAPTTNRKEFIEMAARCSREIKDLRARIAQLEPKAHAYDQLSVVLGLLPRQSQGYGEDLAYTLDKRIAELKAGEDQQTEQGEAA